MAAETVDLLGEGAGGIEHLGKPGRAVGPAFRGGECGGEAGVGLAERAGLAGLADLALEPGEVLRERGGGRAIPGGGAPLGDQRGILPARHARHGHPAAVAAHHARGELQLARGIALGARVRDVRGDDLDVARGGGEARERVGERAGEAHGGYLPSAGVSA